MPTESLNLRPIAMLTATRQQPMANQPDDGSHHTQQIRLTAEEETHLQSYELWLGRLDATHRASLGISGTVGKRGIPRVFVGRTGWPGYSSCRP